eukprot:SAG11_NODE_3780_length_2231_cov_1.947467_4_plen_70_part_00
MTIFNRLDKFNSGVIETKELRTLVYNLGLGDRKNKTAIIAVAEEEIQEAMQDMDINGDGSIDFQEFKLF